MSTEEIIPRIFNYCDNWCERCAFIHRCEVGKMNLDSLNIKTEVTYQTMCDDYNKRTEDAIGILTKALEDNITDEASTPEVTDPLAVTGETEDETIERLLDIFDEHPFGILSEQYMTESSDLLKQKLHIMDRWNELTLHMDIGIAPATEVIAKGKQLGYSVNLIIRYQDMIHSKLFCAMMDLMVRKISGYTHISASRSNGNAKVCLVAIEKSIAAWLFLHSIVDELQDDILTQLATLQKIKKLVETNYPDAWNFKRPGFDD